MNIKLLVRTKLFYYLLARKYLYWKKEWIVCDFCSSLYILHNIWPFDMHIKERELENLGSWSSRTSEYDEGEKTSIEENKNLLTRKISNHGIQNHCPCWSIFHGHFCNQKVPSCDGIPNLPTTHLWGRNNSLQPPTTPTLTGEPPRPIHMWWVQGVWLWQEVCLSTMWLSAAWLLWVGSSCTQGPSFAFPTLNLVPFQARYDYDWPFPSLILH